MLTDPNDYILQLGQRAAKMFIFIKYDFSVNYYELSKVNLEITSQRMTFPEG